MPSRSVSHLVKVQASEPTRCPPAELLLQLMIQFHCSSTAAEALGLFFMPWLVELCSRRLNSQVLLFYSQCQQWHRFWYFYFIALTSRLWVCVYFSPQTAWSSICKVLYFQDLLSCIDVTYTCSALVHFTFAGSGCQLSFFLNLLWSPLAYFLLCPVDPTLPLICRVWFRFPSVN